HQQCPHGLPTRRTSDLFEVGIWHGMWAPKDTPKPVMDKLISSLQAGMADPKFQERMAALGAEVLTSQANPEALTAKVKQQVPQRSEEHTSELQSRENLV